MIYRHTQPGTLVLSVWGAILVLIALLTFRVGPHPAPIGVGLVLLVVAWLFRSLTVEVDERAVTVRFGRTRIGTTVETAAIRSVRAVRNRWYYGWGIRWFARGWLFNVSGLDAVELILRDGRVLRIGTDEPARLAAAIESVLDGRPSEG